MKREQIKLKICAERHRIVVFGLTIAAGFNASVSSLEQGIREGENPVCSSVEIGDRHLSFYESV